MCNSKYNTSELLLSVASTAAAAVSKQLKVPVSRTPIHIRFPGIVLVSFVQSHLVSVHKRKEKKAENLIEKFTDKLKISNRKPIFMFIDHKKYTDRQTAFVFI